MDRMLEYVTSWCGEWKMKINLAKSKIMHFRKKGTE
jgi:hypothetical protein